jgi:glutamyl-tRNA reductase
LHLTQIANARSYVDKEAKRISAMIKAHETISIVRELRKKAEQIRENELLRAMHRLKSISSDDQVILDLLTKSIFNKLLHEPTVRLMQESISGNGGNHEEAIRELFGINTGKSV